MTKNNKNQMLANVAELQPDHSSSRQVIHFISLKVTLQLAIMITFGLDIERFHDMLKGNALHFMDKVNRHPGRESKFLEG